MKDVRKAKVESLIQQELSTLIMQGDIKDPRVNTFLSIKEVRVSPDLSLAKVYMSSFETPAKLEKAVEALNHASGYIQHQMKKRLVMRIIPRVAFFMDTTLAEAFELNKKIDQLVIPTE